MNLLFNLLEVHDIARVPDAVFYINAYAPYVSVFDYPKCLFDSITTSLCLFDTVPTVCERVGCVIRDLQNDIGCQMSFQCMVSSVCECMCAELVVAIWETCRLYDTNEATTYSVSPTFWNSRVRKL
jgi:hypothetical protein